MLTLGLFRIFALAILIRCANGDLYNKTDHVVILTVNNIKQILGNENAWFIQFYSSWCGHCQNFAPTWREFSNSIQFWDYNIKLGVVDCANAENSPVCRDYEVASYPTIRGFEPYRTLQDLGIPVYSRTVEDLENDAIEFIEIVEANGTSPKSWVKLSDYKGDVDEIMSFAPAQASSAVIVIDKLESNVGSKVVMDLGHFVSVYPRSMDVDFFPKNAYEQLPAIIIAYENGTRGNYDLIGGTRELTTAFVMEKLNLVHIPTTMTPDAEVTTPPSYFEDDNGQIVANPAKVYMVDLENTLSYTLTHEVLLFKEIDGVLLNVLKDYVGILLKYLPMRPPVHTYIQRLNDYLQLQNDVVLENDLSTEMDRLNSHDAFLPTNQSWIGCLGSKDKYRGYTCGLWTTFHALTVDAAAKEKNNPNFDSNEVLRAIHGYVKHYFSCSHCSKHFQKMYAIDAEVANASYEHAMIWFWKAHNKVNKRLAGDLTEDPKHPKEQFPPKSLCPMCSRDGVFRQNNAIKFISDMYGRDSISLEGVQQPGVANHRSGRKHSLNSGAGTEDGFSWPSLIFTFILRAFFNY